MRKLLAGLLVAMLGVGVAGAAVLFALYRASQKVPEFYQRALVQATADEESSERFERQALALHNQVRRAGRWEARFSESEINAWLAAVLPEKFPQALSSGVSDPRIAIEGDLIRLAVRYDRGSTHAVISLAARARLTDVPNELAIEIREVRAGALPVPLARFLDEIKLHAAHAGFPLRWTDAAGQPVALVRLPLEAKEPARRLHVERLELDDKALVVGGRTEEDPKSRPVPEAPSLAESESTPAAQSTSTAQSPAEFQPGPAGADQLGETVASPPASETRQR
jgi:hypothetical protein